MVVVRAHVARAAVCVRTCSSIPARQSAEGKNATNFRPASSLHPFRPRPIGYNIYWLFPKTENQTREIGRLHSIGNRNNVTFQVQPCGVGHQWAWIKQPYESLGCSANSSPVA